MIFPSLNISTSRPVVLNQRWFACHPSPPRKIWQLEALLVVVTEDATGTCGERPEMLYSTLDVQDSSHSKRLSDPGCEYCQGCEILLQAMPRRIMLCLTVSGHTDFYFALRSLPYNTRLFFPLCLPPQVNIFCVLWFPLALSTDPGK